MAHEPWIPRLGHELSGPVHGPDLFLCQKEKKIDDGSRSTVHKQLIYGPGHEFSSILLCKKNVWQTKAVVHLSFCSFDPWPRP